MELKVDGGEANSPIFFFFFFLDYYDLWEFYLINSNTLALPSNLFILTWNRVVGWDFK